MFGKQTKTFALLCILTLNINEILVGSVVNMKENDTVRSIKVSLMVPSLGSFFCS